MQRLVPNLGHNLYSYDHRGCFYCLTPAEFNLVFKIKGVAKARDPGDLGIAWGTRPDDEAQTQLARKRLHLYESERNK